MKRFKSFLDEAKVNYNHHTKEWQVRGDDPKHSFKYQQNKVVLKDVKHHVDTEAKESGKKIHTFLQGTPVKEVPKGHTERKIHFNRGSSDHPFVHSDDNSPVHHANYVSFHGNSITAHYKKD